MRNTRYQPSTTAGLAAADVPRLQVKWAFGLPGVSASGSQVTVIGRRAFVGSRNGMVYALDAQTGCIVWTFRADAGVGSTPVLIPAARGRAALYFGDANAQVYSLDATTGALTWKVKVDDHPDGMITGGIVWRKQTLPGDAWNVACLETGAGRRQCPESAGPDHDFGSSPVLAPFPGGRLLLAGQKSGVMHALDPESGEIIWQRPVGSGGVLGGIEWGFAADVSTAYVSLSSALEKKPGEAGGLVAVGREDALVGPAAHQPLR